MKPSQPLICRPRRPLAFCLHACLVACLVIGHGEVLAAATTSIQLKVIGSLVPPSCSLTLPAGDTVDYGRMLNAELLADSLTVLPERNLNFSINCDTPARLALMLQDENAATVVPDLIKVVRGEPDANLMANGLGSVNGINIGIFYVRVFAGAGGNQPGQLRTVRSEGEQGWSETPVDAPLYANGSKPVGFSDGQASMPTALSTVTGRLAIQPLIRPRAELPSADEIVLSGSATLTLYYQ